jgi:hypothetical protein
MQMQMLDFVLLYDAQSIDAEDASTPHWQVLASKKKLTSVWR